MGQKEKGLCSSGAGICAREPKVGQCKQKVHGLYKELGDSPRVAAEIHRYISSIYIIIRSMWKILKIMVIDGSMKTLAVDTCRFSDSHRFDYTMAYKSPIVRQDKLLILYTLKKYAFSENRLYMA
jgi:hypothetical protein